MFGAVPVSAPISRTVKSEDDTTADSTADTRLLATRLFDALKQPQLDRLESLVHPKA